jgi:hypothetical protein
VRILIGNLCEFLDKEGGRTKAKEQRPGRTTCSRASGWRVGWEVFQESAILIYKGHVSPLRLNIQGGVGSF